MDEAQQYTRYVVEVRAFGHHVVRPVLAGSEEEARVLVLAALGFRVDVREQARASC